MRVRLDVSSENALRDSSQQLADLYPEVNYPLSVLPPYDDGNTSVVGIGEYRRALILNTINSHGYHQATDPLSIAGTGLARALYAKRETLAWVDYVAEGKVSFSHSPELEDIFTEAGKTPPRPETTTGDRHLLPGHSLFVVNVARDELKALTSLTLASVSEILDLSQPSEPLKGWLQHCTYGQFPHNSDLVQLIQWYQGQKKEA